MKPHVRTTMQREKSANCGILINPIIRLPHIAGAHIGIRTKDVLITKQKRETALCFDVKTMLDCWRMKCLLL